MSNLVLPEDENSNSETGEKINYEATEADEEKFFLMYNMNLQPSEVDALDPDRRKWIIGRFMAQKSMEQEYMMQQRLRAQIAPNLTGI